MARSREGAGIEFSVHDNLQGHALVASLIRKGIHLERPYSGMDDVYLNDRFIIAKLPSRLASRFAKRISGHPGTDFFLGVFESVNPPLPPPPYAELDFFGGVYRPLSGR